MPFVHTLVYQWGASFATPILGSVRTTADAEDNRDLTILSGGTSLQDPFGVAASKVRLFYALATCDLTLKTNSDVSPDDTLALAANVPFVYQAGMGQTAPFSHDVTRLYILNLTGGTATLLLRILQDL